MRSVINVFTIKYLLTPFLQKICLITLILVIYITWLLLNNQVLGNNGVKGELLLATPVS